MALIWSFSRNSTPQLAEWMFCKATDIEPRKDADEGLADFGVGQAVVVQSVEIERGDVGSPA